MPDGFAVHLQAGMQQSLCGIVMSFIFERV
jgi:hypothetical protein